MLDIYRLLRIVFGCFVKPGPDSTITVIFYLMSVPIFTKIFRSISNQTR